MKNQAIVVLSFIFLFLYRGLSAQIESIDISNGLISSHINRSYYSKVREASKDKKNNSGKIGFYSSAESTFKVFKNISLTGSLTYQERWPLEEFRFFDFDEGNGTFLGNTIAQFPTSPQSSLWDAEKYIRFPNFRYLIIEAIPKINFGKKTKFAVGLGLFYGILLNNSELVFGRNYFPSLDLLFDPPLNFSGADSYQKQDFGWLTALEINHPISERLNLGISTKAYISEYSLRKGLSLSDTFFGRIENDTWFVISGGLTLKYSLLK